jgi:hypothetical protein
MFDIQDESSQTNTNDKQQITLNLSYPHIGDQFEVTGMVCSSTFRIESAGVICKGKQLVYVNGLPISHSFHSTGTFFFFNGLKSTFECTTQYTSCHGDLMIKLALGDGVVLRFTQNSFSPANLFSYFGLASQVTEPDALSSAGADLMLSLVGLAHVFSHQRVLSLIELMIPSHVVSVIRRLPSASDVPCISIDLDMFLSTPHSITGKSRSCFPNL